MLVCFAAVLICCCWCCWLLLTILVRVAAVLICYCCSWLLPRAEFDESVRAQIDLRSARALKRARPWLHVQLPYGCLHGPVPAPQPR